jgi:hypothetical protein
VLYESLTTNGKATVWVICMDDTTYVILNKLNYHNLHAIHYSTCETPELLAIKASRTTGEYCWTFTPFTFTAIFLLAPDLKKLTYVDADLFFMRNFDEIFHELEASNKSVLITKHNYSGILGGQIKENKFGKFCVQFITVKNTIASKKVINWWQNKCIDWCFARVEKGKFGDQKYLDEWPEIFGDDVHILKNPDFALAPWNINSLSKSLKSKRAIFYHFHGFRIINKYNFILFNGYRIGLTTNELYQLYLSKVIKNLQLVEKINPSIKYFTVRDSFINKFKKILLEGIGLRKELSLHEKPATFESNFD